MTTNEATYIERDCTIEHEGRTFEAAGAMVTDDYCIGYVSELPDFPHRSMGYQDHNKGHITDWHGHVLGHVAYATRFRQWVPSAGYYMTMYQITARIAGVWYTGRSQGNGMIWRGKRCKNQAQ